MARVFSQKKEIPADVLVNTLWVSTGLAVILTVPSILIFMFFFLNFDNIIAGAVIGFGLHFILLAFSEKISKFLMSISSTEEPKTRNHGFMASDFTVEMFIRSADLSQISYLWDSHISGIGTAIYINNNRWLFTKDNGLAGNFAANLSLDTWHHIALVRESGTLSGYVDGTRIGQATSSYATDLSSNTISVGAQNDGTNSFNGYIDEFRTSNTARYTGASITAPSTVLPTDSNTFSLLHFDGSNNSTNIINDGKLISATSYERIFNINRIENVGERDRYLKLYCTEGVAT